MLTGKQLDAVLALRPDGRCDQVPKFKQACNQFKGAGCADWCICGWHKTMHSAQGKSEKP